MCRLLLLWVFLISLVVAIPEEHQYCAVRYRRLCQGKGRHVACQFPDSGPGPSCERYTQIKFTNDLKHFITHYLNRRRQRIAAGNERVRGGVHLPKPQVMMLVEWDRELAVLAQRLADQCHFVHDDCRATVRYPYAGQTVGEVRWRRSSESDELSAQRAIRRVLDAWWGERRRVQPKQLTAPFRLTAKGTVWGHFSQLAVWNLQAVGCGAVRHGAHQSRLLLVCDFSHTNMLGQRTLVSGSLAPCPIHTQRRPRTAYPLLCAPVRHPVPAEPEEMELEDNYDDENEDVEEIADIAEVGDAPTQTPWQQPRTERRPKSKSSKKKSTTIREFPAETRKLDTKVFRVAYQTSSTPSKDSIVQKLDRELEQKSRNKVNVNVNFKQAHATFDSNQFDTLVRSDWRTRKRNFGQWRQSHENAENLEEVIPLTVPHTDTETLEPTIAEVYRPTMREMEMENERTEHIPRTVVEIYRPTISEDATEREREQERDHDPEPVQERENEPISEPEPVQEHEPVHEPEGESVIEREREPPHERVPVHGRERGRIPEQERERQPVHDRERGRVPESEPVHDRERGRVPESEPVRDRERGRMPEREPIHDRERGRVPEREPVHDREPGRVTEQGRGRLPEQEREPVRERGRIPEQEREREPVHDRVRGRVPEPEREPVHDRERGRVPEQERESEPVHENEPVHDRERGRVPEQEREPDQEHEQETEREHETEHDETNFRPRWRQTRLRPQRPGANALLSFSSTSKPPKKELIASLNLDKEDIDQLFRDTGFNVNWRKHTT
ncbi:neurofilament heavy polypeptide-like [Helicoverpa zea]|uniref:neurofilament heavy polypeptide-like n=1 Tax=Helicoverpa zea TaxID=7113 RepID=UPI001F56281B|nr:neurofilament heavy polypeptide-like [Helicoverpa zea]